MICKHSRKPQRRQVDTDEFAGGGTYFYCNVQVADNSSSYHGNLEYGRYADCILGHSGSSEAKLQVTGIYVELLRVGIGGRGYIAVCDRCGGENG